MVFLSMTFSLYIKKSKKGCGYYITLQKEPRGSIYFTSLNMDWEPQSPIISPSLTHCVVWQVA